MSDFLISNGKGIESVITTFSNNGKNVKLFPMIHFGLRSFYEKITSDAKKLDVVLYENFDSNKGDENFYMSLMTRRYPGDYNFTMPEVLTMATSLFHSTFARVFGLSDQSIEQIDYDEIHNFHIADVECTDEKIDDYYMKNNDGKEDIFLNNIAWILYHIHLIEFTDMISPKGENSALMNVYNNTIGSFLDKSEFSDMIAFSDEREKQVIDSLRKFSDKGNNIGIIYGAAHMDFFADYLKKNGYNVSSKENFLAIPNIPPRFSREKA